MHIYVYNMHTSMELFAYLYKMFAGVINLTVYIVGTPPLTIGGVEHFSKYEQKGGIGRFLFSGGDKSLKGGWIF